MSVMLNGKSDSKKPTRALSESAVNACTQRIDSQWRRVTKGLSQFTLDLVRGRQIHLLEQLRRDGDAACCTDLSQGGI
jgi:hypothetical protein